MKSKTFNFAEIVQFHEGSLEIAHSFIDALAACGVENVMSYVKTPSNI